MRPYRLTYNDRRGSKQTTVFWATSRDDARKKQDEILDGEGTKCSELFEGCEINPKSNAAIELVWLEKRLKSEGKIPDPLERYRFYFIRSTFGHEGEI